jgi:hypothetical protein
LIVLAISFFVSGCFFSPRTIEYYDAECDIKFRTVVLVNEEIKKDCSGQKLKDPQSEGCFAVVVAMSAGSAIVSGSIVVVGNTVYWLEKQGKCLAKKNS